MSSPVREVREAAIGQTPITSRSVSTNPQRRWLVSPDWLPGALLPGDAVILGEKGLASYWYHVNLDNIRRVDPSGLAFAPYLAAVPVVMVLCVVALSINHQYQSWRGRTLLD